MGAVALCGVCVSISKEEAMSKSREMQSVRSMLPGNAMLNDM